MVSLKTELRKRKTVHSAMKQKTMTSEANLSVDSVGKDGDWSDREVDNVYETIKATTENILKAEEAVDSAEKFTGKSKNYECIAVLRNSGANEVRINSFPSQEIMESCSAVDTTESETEYQHDKSPVNEVPLAPVQSEYQHLSQKESEYETAHCCYGAKITKENFLGLPTGTEARYLLY